MINKWDIISWMDPKTKNPHQTLFIDGTESDARIILRKLKGYAQAPISANRPYTYAFELPCDVDDITNEKIRQAVEEGIKSANKVDQFVPGGSVGDPLFNAQTMLGDKAYPTFFALDSNENMFGKTDTVFQRKDVDLSSVTHIFTQADTDQPLQVKRVQMNENLGETVVQDVQPDKTSFSTTVREVFGIDAQGASAQNQKPQDEFNDLTFDPVDPTIPPQQTPPPAQPTEPTPKSVSQKEIPSGTLSINDRDMLIKDMEGSMLEKMPLEDILSAQTKYDMFVDVSPTQNTQQTQQQKEAKMQQAQDGTSTFNVFGPEAQEPTQISGVEEVETITDKLAKKNMDFIDNSPEQENMPQPPDVSTHAETNVPHPAPANEPTATLPEINIREQQPTMQNAPAKPAGPSVVPPTPAQQPPHAKTVLRLKPNARPTASEPQSEDEKGKTILRLRRKETPTQPPVAQPIRSTVSPQKAAEITRLAKKTAIDHSIEMPSSELKKHNWPLEVPLVPTYTLNNMVMSVNRFAHATAISVIDNPGKLYNPLVLHGGTGTGKTHFLNALAYSFSKKFGQEHIFMTNGVRLSRGIQRYVMEGNIEKFENFMSSVQVLLIDDIHLLAINEQNRSFVSDLLNAFRREQKQIVITSKYPPDSLGKLEELINFKLDSGWISELKPATGATHFRIVKKMLLESGIDLNDKQIEEFFSGNNMTLGTITRSIRRLKVLDTLLPHDIPQEQRSSANVLEKLLATKGEDRSSKLLTIDPSSITSLTPPGNGEWGRIGFFYPQNNSDMMNWMVYALGQRAKELGIKGGFEIVVRSSYSTENIISSAFKIANLCDNKKLKGAVVLGPVPNTCDPSVRENFYDILTHMLEIMLIRCGIINFEDVRLPSTYVKVISELMR